MRSAVTLSSSASAGARRRAVRTLATVAAPAPPSTTAARNPKPQRRTVLVDGTRTPFCVSGTAHANLLAVDLARAAIHGLLVKTAFEPRSLDGVILGTVIQEGACRARGPARHRWASQGGGTVCAALWAAPSSP